MFDYCIVLDFKRTKLILEIMDKFEYFLKNFTWIQLENFFWKLKIFFPSKNLILQNLFRDCNLVVLQMCQRKVHKLFEFPIFWILFKKVKNFSKNTLLKNKIIKSKLDDNFLIRRHRTILNIFFFKIDNFYPWNVSSPTYNFFGINDVLHNSCPGG